MEDIKMDLRLFFEQDEEKDLKTSSLGEEPGEEEEYDIGEEGGDFSEGESFDDSQEKYTPKTPEEIGKLYELKKIYFRLIALQSYLSDFSDEKFFKIRNYILEASDLFLIISKNMEIFKSELDEIIILYYKFLKTVYMIVKKIIKTKKLDDMGGEQLQKLIHKIHQTNIEQK